MPSLLVILIFLPAVGAAMLLLLDPKAPPSAHAGLRLLTTIVTFLVSLGVASQFLAIDRTPRASTAPVHPVMEVKHAWLNLAQQHRTRPRSVLNSSSDWMESVCRWFCSRHC